MRLSRFEAAAFTTGFALLAYELAAARILSPTIGSSTYVWTSVIGVIIAALSLGYAAGGFLADKRVRKSDIAMLLLAAAGSVLLTLLISDTVLAKLTAIKDPRMQGILAATVLFSLTSFIVGVISPYLARLRTVSVETTGSSIAMLNAANAIGGITGTFSVGFIFFGYIGSKETLVFTAILLALTAVLFAPWRELGRKISLGLLAMIVGLIIFPPVAAEGQVADVDTPSARYRIKDIIYNGEPARILVSGPRAAQSGIYLDGSNELVFWYTKQMARLVGEAPKRERMLVLGGGAFTLPAYLADKYPAAQIDVAEIDPKLLDVSRQYFNFRDRLNLSVYAEDARAYLNRTRAKYDLVLVDVYSDNAIPFSVATIEYAQKLKEALNPGGVVIANIIGSKKGACGRLLKSIHRSYTDVWNNYAAFPQVDSGLFTRQNIIFAYSDSELPFGGGMKPALGGGQLLTDNFAPVERMKVDCLLTE